MQTSKADRLAKLFERESLPPLPEPSRTHIADSEIISKMPAAKPSRKVSQVAPRPNQVAIPPPQTGQDFEQLTSSDDDEYVRAFRKTPAIKAETAKKSQKKGSTNTGYRHEERPLAKVGPQTARVLGESDVKPEGNGGISSPHRSDYPLVGRFCLFNLVTKFCYKYMDDPNDRVSKRFFASGKIWKRTWDIYFIHPPVSLSAKPLLLVPEAQVQILLDEINAAFKISIKLPRYPFVLTFYRDGTPAPIRLGSSQSREGVEEMQQKMPPSCHDHGECPPAADPELRRCFGCFKEAMERATAEQKKKNATTKRAKAKSRLAAHVNSCEALKRGQRYLGLRPVDRKGGLPLPDPSLCWEEQQSVEREQKIKYGHILLSFDVEKLAPHQFDRDVIFISVDVESYERNHDLITEVGISTLDTANIKSVVPGHGGSNWMELIRSRHFRIRNYAHLVNTTFCVGNPERFLFGHSEFVSMDEIGKAVDSCFEPPYSAELMHDGVNRAQEDKTVVDRRIGDPLAGLSLQAQKAGEGTQRSPQAKDRQENNTRRNIILVGHSLDGDLRYLSTLNSEIFQQDTEAVASQSTHSKYTPILESLDTATLYQGWKQEANPASLAKVLYSVERTGWELHNAGNDARYTLEALVGILLAARVEDGSKTNDDEAERELEKRIKERRDAVESQERENAAMWKHALGDDAGNEHEHGGGGVLLSDPYQPASEATPPEHSKGFIEADCAPGHGGLDADSMRGLPDDFTAPPDQSLSEGPSLETETRAQHAYYPWSSGARATLDGGEPKAFQMPPRSKSAKGKSRTWSREGEGEGEMRSDGW